MPLFKNRFLPLFTDPSIPNNITCDEPEYCHQFIPGDHLRAQFYQTPCGQNEVADPTFSDATQGADIITNGTFTGSAAGWTLGGNWVYGTNDVDCTAGSASTLSQFGIGLSAGQTYRVTFDLTRTAGSLHVELSAGPTIVTSVDYDVTGSYSIDLFIPAGILTDEIRFITDTSFVGSLDNITCASLTYTSWTENSTWGFSTGYACKTDDTLSGTLTESVANYTTLDGYYQLSFTISSYVSGTIVPKVAGVTDQDTTVVSANGNYTLYFETGASGVISFEPSADFIGCVSVPDLRELRNDYVIEIVSDAQETALYTIEASYYHQYVTFDYDIEGESIASDGVGLPYGCYNVQLFDSCTALGNNLITNPSFSSGVTDWTLQTYGNAYSTAGSQLAVTFDPLTGANLITNGTFASGASWTAGAGWAIGAGVATHTPGSTATLSQTITIDSTAYTHWYIKFTISGRTAGSVSVSVGGAASSSFSVNDTIVTFVQTNLDGAVTFAITPSSTFDGSIDNVEVYEQYNMSPAFIITNTVNPLMVAANYNCDVELVATADADAKGVLPAISGVTLGAYSNTVGTVSNTYNGYTPGSNQGQVWISFRSATVTGQMYPGTITIDNVNLYRIAPFEATFISECFQYRESLPKSKAFIGYCDSNSLGFDFANTGFKLFQRLVCRSFAPSFETDRKIFNYGSGVSGVYYSEIQKWYGVYLDAVPETVHDGMAISLNCDHFLIGDTEDNATEYVAKPDDYTPEWERSGIHSLATVRFDVKPKEDGQFFNRDC